MSKMTSAVKENRAIEKDKKEYPNRVENFMGGYSYELNPLDTLKMVSASSIFGEPQYYRRGEFAEARVHDGKYRVNSIFTKYCLLSVDKYGGMPTSDLMEKVIDEALDYDFAGVLEWAKILRKEYYMRLNPQVIMVRAAIHPKRIEYTDRNPNSFSSINKEVMARGDDVISQLTYYLFIKGDKKTIPGILKRSWAKKIETLSRYEIYKYRNHGVGLIDTVRICHAHSDDIDELMKSGTIDMPETNKTWETLRASGMSWVDIVNTINMNHMALLRNLRGIFKENDDVELCKKLMDLLVKGVEKGKQFPYRYMSALNSVKKDAGVHHKGMICDSLEDCMDAACVNLPKLKGKSAFLSDNSGSAWGTLTSEYGSVRVAEIDNLSAVIGAANSDEGVVFPFGDRLLEYPISKRQGILHQATEISREAGNTVGGGTENGIWLFFDKAINEKIVWDNIFIYSDMQAGHGDLYGVEKDVKRCRAMGCTTHGTYIDVAKLINVYRKQVNPKVNVFCVQTAGYDNVLVPENGYRTSILYGWTGKELLYADCINKFWDEKDEEHSKK